MPLTITAPFHPETGIAVEIARVPKEILIGNLREAIELMNDGGTHWIQGSYTRPFPDGSMGYCAFAAVGFSANDWGGSINEGALLNALVSELLITLGQEPRITWAVDKANYGVLKQVIDPCAIFGFNDAPERTWTEVRSLFESTIERLEREEC